MTTKPDEKPGAPAAPETGAPAQTLPPAVCALCDADVLHYSSPLLRIDVQQALPVLDESGTFDLAKILARPTDVSGDALICTSCSMTPLWVVAKRLFSRRREVEASEPARTAKPAARN